MDIQEYSIADYHVHPDFSFDAEGSIEEYCQMALAQGLSEICFTTHYDTNPILSEKERSICIEGKLVPHSIKNFGAYIMAIQKAHNKFYEYGLSVKSGVEVGYFPGCEKDISDLFNFYPIDHKIGSIHDVDDCSICYEDSVLEFSQKNTMEKFLDRHYDLLKQMIKSELFDVVGHLDRYRTHGKKFYGEQILKEYQGRIEPIFELMKKHNVGYEVNTVSVHYGESDYYPSMGIINLGRKMGVGPTCIGSDAHSPDELSRDFEMAVSVAHELFPYRGE